MQDLSKRITSNKSKHLLVQNELKKLQTFESSYFKGKNYFEEDGNQNYLVFQAMKKYFLKIGDTESVSKWKSKGLSNKSIKAPNNSPAPTLKCTGKECM